MTELVLNFKTSQQCCRFVATVDEQDLIKDAKIDVKTKQVIVVTPVPLMVKEVAEQF